MNITTIVSEVVAFVFAFIAEFGASSVPIEVKAWVLLFVTCAILAVFATIFSQVRWHIRVLRRRGWRSLVAEVREPRSLHERLEALVEQNADLDAALRLVSAERILLEQQLAEARDDNHRLKSRWFEPRECNAA